MEMFHFLLFSVVILVAQGLHKDSTGIPKPVELVALVAEHRQPEPVSLPYPGALGPVDPSSPAKNVVVRDGFQKRSSGFPIGPVGPQRQTDIYSDIWPQVEPIESAKGWLPPVDPYSAARNVQRVARGSDISNKNDKAETNIKHNADQKDASTFTGIVGIFFIMYVPLLLLWFCASRQMLMLMPATYVLLQIGEDLVSQSLVDQMHDAFFPLLVLKALAVVSLFGQWLLFWGRQYLQTVSMSMLQNAVIVVGPLYAGYQLLNQVLHSDCTLAEHLAFTNFCPPLVFLIERLLVPRGHQPKENRSIKMSLCAIAVGAVVFCFQGARFKITSSMWGYAGMTLLYYASQRWYMSKNGEVPISLLVIINGCALLLPAIILSFTVSPQWHSASQWIHSASVLVMIFLAAATYACKFYVATLMLSTASATSLLVNSNLANCGVVILGLLFFGNASGMNGPCFYVGLLVLLVSCIWYCYEASDAEMTKKMESKTKAADKRQASEHLDNTKDERVLSN